MRKYNFAWLNSPIANIVLIAAMVVAVCIALLSFESEVLFRMQELDLFLFTKLFFTQQMVVPGGMLAYLGSFFTQFMYVPWLGVLMLGVWLALLAFVTRKAVRLRWRYTALTLVTLSLVVATIVNQGYWIYYLKLHGTLFSTVIAVTATMALVWLYRSLTNKYIRIGVLLATMVVGFPLMGVYAIAAIALMIVSELSDNGFAPWTAIHLVVALVAVFGLAHVFYHYVYYQTSIENFFVSGLPLYKVSERNCADYYLPFILLGVVMVAMMFVGKLKDRAATTIVIDLAAIAVSVYTLTANWYSDDNFHKEVAMINRASVTDWDGVLDIAKSETTEPNRLMVLLKDVALFKKGEAGDKMYYYADGDSVPNAPFEVRMPQVGGLMVYLQYGQTNFCYRWCLENGVEYGWRVEDLKYVTKCALLNGEWQLAKKYINILKSTLYYKEWAERYEPMLANHSLVKKDKELGGIMPLKDYANIITSDQALPELYLINTLSHTYAKNRTLAELCMMCALRSKDITTFWNNFWNYTRINQNRHVPTHYQEAAYVYGHLENTVDISGMPFDKEVKDRFDAFWQQVRSGQYASEADMAAGTYQEWGNTFYYNYFFVRDQNSY